MPKIKKWIKEYVIQEFTGYGRGGWEDSTTEESPKDAREQMKCYRNAGVTARLIVRRVINPEWEKAQKEAQS
jgi:hypothetical protein